MDDAEVHMVRMGLYGRVEYTLYGSMYGYEVWRKCGGSVGEEGRG